MINDFNFVLNYVCILLVDYEFIWVMFGLIFFNIFCIIKTTCLPTVVVIGPHEYGGKFNPESVNLGIQSLYA